MHSIKFKKLWMKKQTKKKSKGLGDTVAKITEATGLDKLAKKLSKLAGQEDCGCNRRREIGRAHV